MNKVFYIAVLLSLFSNSLLSQGYDVLGYGYYNVKFDGSESNEAFDFRYERRFDKSLFEIGPEEENFFNLKPFAGLEATSESAYYILGGVYLDDNLGTLFTGKETNFLFTPSFGAGYYDDGNGKKLGSNIQFRTTLEISYQIENRNRIGLSLSHISNANIADKNPGVEILSLTYQVPFN